MFRFLLKLMHMFMWFGYLRNCTDCYGVSFVLQLIRVSPPEAAQDRKPQQDSSPDDTPPMVKKEPGTEPGATEQAPPTGRETKS